MEKERVVGLGILDQPMHRAQNICFGRLAHGILLVIGQNNHVFPRIAEVSIKVRRHVLDVVDTASELSPLTEVVDTNQKSFAPTRAVGVLKAVTLRSAMAKGLHGLGRWRWGVVVSLDVGIGIDGRKAWCTSMIVFKGKRTFDRTWSSSVLWASVRRRLSVTVSGLRWGLHPTVISMNSPAWVLTRHIHLLIASAVRSGRDWRRLVVAVAGLGRWGRLRWIGVISSLRTVIFVSYWGIFDE